jgi:hypothetical protein
MLARALYDDPVFGWMLPAEGSRLKRCDQEGLPAYLESSNLGNVPLYRHFGFRVTGTFGPARGCTRCQHHVAAGRLER